MPSFFQCATAKKASFSWTKRSKNWAGCEILNSLSMSDSTERVFIQRTVKGSSDGTRGAKAILCLADIGNRNSITYVRTVIHLLKWSSSCSGTVGLSLSCSDGTLEDTCLGDRANKQRAWAIHDSSRIYLVAAAKTFRSIEWLSQRIRKYFGLKDFNLPGGLRGDLLPGLLSLHFSTIS